jgi:hypothetical protein
METFMKYVAWIVVLAFCGSAALSNERARPPYVPDNKINTARVNVLAAADAERIGEFAMRFPVGHLKSEVIDWKSPDQALTWTINVAADGDYLISAILEQNSGPQLNLSVNAATNIVMAPFVQDPRGFASRSDFGKSIHLKAVRQSITLRIAPALSANDAFSVDFLALELVTRDTKDTMSRQALAMRADGRWLARERFGVMTHWTKRTMPRKGPQLNYTDAVNAFDVDQYANQIASTGASFVVFTTSHSDQYFPAPIAALDKILLGRTTRRDLIGELIAAFKKRDMKFFLYYHIGPIEDPAWGTASGLWETDTTRLFKNWRSIIGEVGLRYGKKLDGWWFDDGVYNYMYRSPNWQSLDLAAKAGNETRLVCFNSWSSTSATEFQDYHCGEELAPNHGINARLNHDGSFNGTLTKGGDGRITKGAFKGLQAVSTFVLESDWIHTKRDTEAAEPKISPIVLADTLNKIKAYGGTPIINMLVYQDGVIPAKSLETVRMANGLLEKN